MAYRREVEARPTRDRQRIHAPRLLERWSSTGGRWLRIYAGANLLVIGLGSGVSLGYLLAVVGGALLIGGAGDVSLLARLLGGPFQGEDLRSRLGVIRDAELVPQRWGFRLP